MRPPATMLGRLAAFMLVSSALPGAISIAGAAVQATPAQTAAIAPAVGFPANCITASIAESDPSWATAKPGNGVDCPQADGAVVLHLNGGVPSRLVTQIRWRHWGSAHAIGVGKNAIYRPGGGYYARRATIKLRASRRGRCPDSDQPAYRRLEARLPSRPGGKLGPWFLWAGARTICSVG